MIENPEKGCVEQTCVLWKVRGSALVREPDWLVSPFSSRRLETSGLADCTFIPHREFLLAELLSVKARPAAEPPGRNMEEGGALEGGSEGKGRPPAAGGRNSSGGAVRSRRAVQR